VKRRIARAVLLNILAVGAGFLSGVIIVPLAIRVLGRDAYGIWVLLTSFSAASGFLSILDLGIQSSIVKFVAGYHATRDMERVNQVFSVGFYLFVGLGFFGASVLILFAQFFLTQVFSIPNALVSLTRFLFYILAVQVLVEFPSLVFSAVVDGVQRYDLQRFVQIGYIITYLVFCLVFLSRGHGLLALSVGMLLLVVVRGIVLTIVALNLMPGLRLTKNFDRALLRHVATFSGQVFLIRLNAVVYNTMDKVIIGSRLSSSVLTEYDIASKLRNVGVASLSFITPQIVPVAAGFNASGDKSRLQEVFIRGTKYQLAICLPVTIIVFVMAADIIRLWIGSDYVYTANLTRLCVSYLFFDAIVVVGYNMMIGMGRIRHLLMIQAITTTAVNLCVSILLTPRVGVSGVMWGTLIGTVLSVGPYLRMYLKALDLSFGRFWREVIRPTYGLAAIFGVVLHFAVNDWMRPPESLLSLCWLGSFALAMYYAAFALFGLGKAERMMLRSSVGI